MKPQKTTAGFSFVEMIMTVTIMMIFGMVGMTTVSSLKNYFLVEGAEEKLVSAFKGAKKTVLEGDMSCSRVAVFEGDDQENQNTMFIVERWAPPPVHKDFFCGKKLNGEKAMTNLLEGVELITEDEELYIALTLKEDYIDDFIYPQAFNHQVRTIALVDGDFSPIEGNIMLADNNEIYVPMSNYSDYFVKIYDKMQAIEIASIDVHFYNADAVALASEDPSVIRIEKIEGQVKSSQTKQGNIEVVYQAPFAKALTLIHSGGVDYKAKNIQMTFVNENEAEGEFSFFNASLLNGDSQKVAEKESSTCSLNQESLELTCIKQE